MNISFTAYTHTLTHTLSVKHDAGAAARGVFDRVQRLRISGCTRQWRVGPRNLATPDDAPPPGDLC